MPTTDTWRNETAVSEAVSLGHISEISFAQDKEVRLRLSDLAGLLFLPSIADSAASAITQVPRWQRWSRGGGGLRRAAAEDGAVGLVVNQVGHVGALFVLGEADGVAASGAQVGVTTRGVTADRALVSTMRAGLEGHQGASEDTGTAYMGPAHWFVWFFSSCTEPLWKSCQTEIF